MADPKALLLALPNDVINEINNLVNNVAGYYKKTGGEIGGDVTVAGSLTTSGNITSEGTITATKIYNAVYNDYAEFFPRGEATEVGDIIALDETSEDKEQYVKASSASKVVIGVHSGQFAQIIGGENFTTDFVNNNMAKYIPIGLAGRVLVKFFGEAHIGDKVVPGDDPGVGRAYVAGVDDPWKVVGILLEEDEVKTLRLLKIKIV